jgi:large subunit ribosomal protein L13
VIPLKTRALCGYITAISNGKSVMKTVSITSTQAKRAWHIVDMEGLTLGRAASRIATVLRGKHKPTWTPHDDTGDFVVVINADKFKLTGNKRDQKRYYRYAGTIGNLRERTVTEMIEMKPGECLKKAVAGMLPHNRLGRQMLKKLKVYPGTDHPHAAQQPTELDLKTI